MNTRNKWFLKAQSLILVLSLILTSLLIFNTDKTYAGGGSTAVCLKQSPYSLPVTPNKVRVVYEIKNVNENDGTKIGYSIRKLAFSGDVVTEKASNLKGYELVSESTQTVTLQPIGNAPIVFKYRPVDQVALERLKTLTKEKIDLLKKAPLYEKNDYKDLIDRAYTEKEVNDLFEEIKKIDDNTRVQVKYQIKYVDANGEAIAPTVTKLGFSGEYVTEEAMDIEGYVKPSETVQSLTLDVDQNEIVFTYDKRMQVIYEIRYVNEADESKIGYSIRKIAFSGDVVTEKASNFKGYELVSEPTQTITLKSTGNEPMIFKFKAVDVEALDALKTLTKEKIDELKKAPLYEKNDYKEQIDRAFTEEEVNKLFEEIQKIDEGTKLQVQYQIKYVDPSGAEVAPTVTKLGFTGDNVMEEAIDVENYIKPEETVKSLTLSAEQNEIVFTYEKSDEAKSLLEFISEKAVPYKKLTYSNINFANRPEALKEFITKNVYRHNLSIEFYATESDVDVIYNKFWNKTSNNGLIRLARFWTSREDVRKEETSTPGVYRYVIGITYHLSADQMTKTENKIDELIEKYDLRNKTDLEKAKIIHDYLVKYVTPNTGQKEWGYNVYNYSSVLLGNVGVCEGYAMAYSRIAERVGLETRFVPGILLMYISPSTKQAYIKKVLAEMQTETFDRRMNHAWNQVKINGKWYHLDSYHASYFYHTPEYNNDMYIYYNFLKSEKTLWKDHEDRLWNNLYTEESLEDYDGNFTLDKNF